VEDSVSDRPSSADRFARRLLGSRAESARREATRRLIRRSTPATVRGLALAAVWLLSASIALARFGEIQFHDGTRLRGDVTETENEVILRNAAGETRYPRSAVQRVLYNPLSASVDEDHRERAGLLAPDDVDGHFALAEWLRSKGRYDLVRIHCNFILGLRPDHVNAKLLLAEAERRLARETEAPATRPAPRTLVPPPLLSAHEINRLRLYELRLDGLPEDVAVQFRKERTLESDLRERIAASEHRGPDWEAILARGRPNEKLHLIVRTTGLEYADRIDVRSDPEVFATFRRQVLPLINTGCARSGCHSGPSANALRLPVPPQPPNGLAYTTFLLLDQYETAAGPLIDRGDPRGSVLAQFMLPAALARHPHPPVRNTRLVPVVESTADPRYRAVLEWIGALRFPHPRYKLDYVFPEWMPPRSSPASAPVFEPADPPEALPEEDATLSPTGEASDAPTSAPSTSAPASAPSGPAGRSPPR
jgi:hypothetical protein